MNLFVRLLAVATLLAAGELTPLAKATASPSEVAKNQRDLAGSTWSVRVVGADGKEAGTLLVLFTDSIASSCMAGHWKRATVLRSKSKVPEFIGSRPLSYSLEDGEFILGANDICDGYLWLRGKLTNGGASGRYISLGLGGSKELGEFTASRADAATAPNKGWNDRDR